MATTAHTDDRFLAEIDGYLVDLTNFMDHHPGSKAKIVRRREKNFDISSNFLDHFGHTVTRFRQATREFDRNGGSPVTFTFKETPNAPVIIVGRPTK